MRLFIDAHLFDDGFQQGSKTYLRELYNELIPISPDIEFFFCAVDPSLVKSEIINAPNVHFIKYAYHNKFYRLSIEIPQLIEKHKIDFAHYQYITPLFKTCKEIITIHDLLFIDFPNYFPFSYRVVKNYLFRRSAKRAELLLTVSEYSKASIVKNYKISEATVYLTPNGVSPNSFVTKTNTPVDIKVKYNLKKYILYVSRFEPRKNHITLLKAFESLPETLSSFQLVFVGKRSLEVKEFDNYYGKLAGAVRDKILLIENVSHDELLSFYSNCSVFVFPSLAEGFGIPPLEAVALNATTLCSNTTAMAEFTFLGDQLFNPSDLSELTKKLTYYLLNPISGQTREQQRDIVFQKYSWFNSAKLFRSYLMNEKATSYI
jgi:glycosyltransferase involved in cell wall biosynthesis